MRSKRPRICRRIYRASIEALESRQLLSGNPTVTTIAPFNGATNVARNAAAEADFYFPNAALDPHTVTTGTVLLFPTANPHSFVPAVVNTTGGDDAIILQPSVLLDANTNYTFQITSGVRDVTGAPVVPYSITFTTGTAGATADPTLAFQQTALPTTAGVAFSTVRVGPDHELWAGAEDGRIFRYPINADGTLGTPQIITSLQMANGGPRLLTGFAFDPASTAANPIIWASNSYYAFSNAPDLSSKITRLSGPNLAQVQDAVVGLPRSVLDHTTDQPTFGHDGVLYFAQGADNSMGGPDTAWGMRAEHLLSSAILRLDPSKLDLSQALDVRTSDVGGTYDPFAADAPLTIYATGVRNAFQLLWTQDGHLLAPVNGASAGGNTPAGPGVPALNAVPQVESDYLYNVVQGGYYGHPNPAQGHYVLDGGNPTAAVDPAEIAAYPVGTQPDSNYRFPAFDFGLHRSPDGIIQYSGNAFNGALNGKILVTEFSAGDDIAVLTPDANGNIIGVNRDIAGLSGFHNPLNLAEDPATGNLYVAELFGQKITLLTPIQPHPTASISKALVVFDAVDGTSSGAQTVTVTNSGTMPLELGPGGLNIVDAAAPAPADSADFMINNLASVPATLSPGQSVDVSISFTSPSAGLHTALLQVTTNDAANPVQSVQLHGLGTTGTGGANEPSLAAILRTYNIPTIVGDGPNDASAFTSTFYPNPPDPSSQEVPLQRLVKAGAGPVTITPLAVFAVANQPTLRMGYYTPGDPTDLKEVFGVNAADAQTVNPTPQGATAFDPGSAEFGLYTNFPTFIDAGHQRVSYSEDALNTWDTAVQRKMRFFPLESPDGTVVPNAYIFAAEDNNKFFPPNILPYDSNDIVGIIRNVRAAPGAPDGAVLGLQNLDGLPYSDRLIFNRIQIPNATVGDTVHDTSTIQIDNTGDQPLTISGLTLSDPANWQVVAAPTSPIAPGGSADVTIKFIATTNPPHTDNQTNDSATTNGISVQDAGGVWNGTLTISSNDAARPDRVVQLAGYWQYQSEHENEPGLQTIVNMAGYGVVTGAGSARPDLTQKTTPVYYGQEVASGLWESADPTLPVSVQMLDSFHNQGNSSTLYWYDAGTSNFHSLLHINPDEGQTLLPHMAGTTNFAQAGFTPTGAFGWNADGELSEDSRNTADITMFGRSGHAVRFYPLRNEQGIAIPNAWLMVQDYEAGPFDNSDFQDLAYVVTNMRPASTPPTPADLTAVPGAAVGVTLQWAPVSYAGAVGYDVYRSNSPTGPFTKLNAASVSGTSFTDQTAPGGTSYYRVVAVDLASGASSTPADASAASLNVGPPGALPAPANLTGVVNSSSSITLTWDAAAGTADYHVERLDPGQTIFREIAAGITGNTFTDTGLTPGATYMYRVRAESSGAFSPYSGVVTADTLTGVVPQPPPPGQTPPGVGQTPAPLPNQGPPQVAVAGTFGTVLRGSRHLRSSLSPADKQHLYSFTLTGLSRVTITLQGLLRNADLQLLDGSLKVLGSSSHPRRRSETISLLLGPGTYYIKAYLIDAAGTPFGLNLGVRPIKVRVPKVHHPKVTQIHRRRKAAVRAAVHHRHKP